MNIGLIAMSGVRACDQQLMALGMSLPGFVERSRVIASLPSLGLLTLAGATPAGHTLRYLEMPQLPSSDDREALPDFDLVAISSYSAQIFEAYDLADRYRRRGARVVMGGLHVTALPDEALEHCDAVVVGEGEPCWPQVVRDAERRCLQPRYQSDGRYDLAQSPMPAFELLHISRYNRLTVQTSRGCPWRCNFCASSILLTDRYKQKPPERVIAEIDRIIELWPRPFIEFADDNGMVNRAYWLHLLPQLARRRLRWFTETDVSVGADDALLTAMAAAGCAEVLIGLENPSAAGLDGLELRRNWKRNQLDRHQTLVRNIQRHGIRVNGCFILGLDGHDMRVFDDVAAAAEALELYDVQITVLTPFPGTPLHEQLQREGRLTHPGQWNRCTLFDINYRPALMSASQLRAGFHNLAARLYSEEAARRRRDRFNQHRRAARTREAS